MGRKRNLLVVVDNITGETIKVLNGTSDKVRHFMTKYKKLGCMYHECEHDKFGTFHYNRFVGSRITIIQYLD